MRRVSDVHDGDVPPRTLISLARDRWFFLMVRAANPA
jgi:hypothetical protein